MTRNRNLVITSVVVVVAILMITMAFGRSDARAANDTNAVASYAPLSNEVTDGIGATLEPLSSAQVSDVAIDVPQVEAVANLNLPFGVPNGAVPDITLGSFTDSEYKMQDSSELVAQNLPAYVVTYSGLSIPSANPMSKAIDTEESVVVNAVTGATSWHTQSPSCNYLVLPKGAAFGRIVSWVCGTTQSLRPICQ